MDTIINYIYDFIRDLSGSAFFLIMIILGVLGFYFFSLFLKANKKDGTKINKISWGLTVVLIIALIVILTNIRY